jgi:hypothetical protein
MLDASILQSPIIIVGKCRPSPNRISIASYIMIDRSNHDTLVASNSGADAVKEPVRIWGFDRRMREWVLALSVKAADDWIDT